MKQELFSSIEANKRKAAFIMSSIAFLFLLFNLFVWWVFREAQAVALGISLFTFAYVAVAYVRPINVAAAFLRAKKVDEAKDIREKKLSNILDEMVIAGLLEKKPDLYIIESE